MEQLANCVDFFNKLILKELSKCTNTWIAGGAVRDYFSGVEFSDIDLFFKTEKDLNDCLNYFTKHIYYYGTTESKPMGEIYFESKNVVKVRYKGFKFDLVKKLFNDPKKCIDEFDFTICCVAVDNKKTYVSPTFFMDLAKRALVINKIPYPLSTIWRMQKYIKKGFTICQNGLMKISIAICTLELHAKQDEKQQEEVEELYDSDNGSMFDGID